MHRPRPIVCCFQCRSELLSKSICPCPFRVQELLSCPQSKFTCLQTATATIITPWPTKIVRQFPPIPLNPIFTVPTTSSSTHSFLRTLILLLFPCTFPTIRARVLITLSCLKFISKTDLSSHQSSGHPNTFARLPHVGLLMLRFAVGSGISLVR